MKVFAEDGYRGSSLSRVAHEAGLTQAGLLHHFGSKKALLAEVLRRRDALDGERFAGAGGPTGFERLETLVELTRWNATRPGVVKLFTTICGEAVDPEHPGHEWLREHLAFSDAAVVEALTEGIRAGTVRPETPVREVAAALNAAMDGLQIRWLVDPEVIDLTESFIVVFDALRARWELTAGDGSPSA